MTDLKATKTHFIEIGCANNAADLVQPCIDAGLRGLFIDADQEILIKRKHSLRENPNSHVDHLFLCCLVDVNSCIRMFYKTDFGYSSCKFEHVAQHVCANQQNNDIPKEEREYKMEQVESILMPAFTITEILTVLDEPDLALLNIDCEGFDCRIVASADFSKYRPRVICFEHSHCIAPFVGFGEDYDKAVANLNKFGYQIKAQNVNDSVFALAGI